jgi:hypothetical protein
MIVNAPTLAQGGPARILVLKAWVKITIQVINNPNLVFVGTSKDEAGLNSLGDIQDGLQFNQANASVPVQIWWKGELWMSGSAPGSYCIVLVVGNNTQNFEPGGDQCSAPTDQSYTD